MRGLLTLKDTDGIDLKFGRADLIIPVIEKIALRDGALGGLLAEGVKRAAEKIGNGSEYFAMHGKGLTYAGHSARFVRNGRQLTFEEALADVTAALQQERRAQAVSAWMERLRRRAELRIVYVPADRR